MATVVKLSSKNQIVIPREARQAMGVHGGDPLLIVIKGGITVLMPRPESYHDALSGSASSRYGDDYLDDERQTW